VYAFSSGPPSEATGGFGESTCFFCHAGIGVNTGPGSITISAPAAYSSGQTYEITVRVADPNQRRWGFELSARTENGQQAGGLSPTNNQTQLVPTFNGIQYIAHTSVGTRPGVTQGVNFTFNWTAPDSSSGPVVMHAAGNAANNSNSESGDRIYTTSVIIPPEVSGPPPAVSEGGVVNNASFALHPAPMAPGSIAAIFGNDLNDGSEVANSGFGPDGKLLTLLGGASAKVNGVAAPVFYSFSGQLGVQIPFEMDGATTASIEVTTRGQTSPPRTIFIDSFAPGIFATNQQGTEQGAILIANSDILAAPAGSIPGRTTRPAQRNENITIFATGLGMVNGLETGAPSQGETTVTAAEVLIDNIPAQVLFSGTAPGFVGLNQINVTVPASTTIGNSVPVVVRIGGKQSNTVTIAVSQ
jgi:uncharacterized protein (TIGR03437 family)